LNLEEILIFSTIFKGSLVDTLHTAGQSKTNAQTTKNNTNTKTLLKKTLEI